MPMIDGAMPGATAVVLTIGPAAIGVLAMLVGAATALAAGTARERRRTAASDAGAERDRDAAEPRRLAA